MTFRFSLDPFHLENFAKFAYLFDYKTRDFNLLATDFFLQILAHSVFKM